MRNDRFMENDSEIDKTSRTRDLACFDWFCQLAIL